MAFIQTPPVGETIVNPDAVRRGEPVTVAMCADGRDRRDSHGDAADFDTTGNPGQPDPLIASTRAPAGRVGLDWADFQATARQLPATPAA